MEEIRPVFVNEPSNFLNNQMRRMRERIILRQYQQIQRRLKNLGSSFSQEDGNELPHAGNFSVEAGGADLLIESSHKQIKSFEKTTELNKDTQKALNGIIKGIEESTKELEKDFLAATQRLGKAKESFDCVLCTYYPDMLEELTMVLKTLEDLSSAENEEDKYSELNNINLAPALVLLKSKCIVPHPVKSNYFKLAPLI